MSDLLAHTPAAAVQRTERQDTILALLEERPYQTSELAATLAVHNGIVAMICKQLAREGRVVKGADWRWHLALTPGAVPRPATRPVAPRRSRLTPIANVRVVHDAAAPAVRVGDTRVIDGVEFEVMFDGRGGSVGDAAGLGSTLSGHSFQVRLQR